MHFNTRSLVAFGALVMPACDAALSPLRYANILTRSDQVKDLYDYIVIGGGTAGLTVSDRLTESGQHSVLTIKYGDPIPDAVIAANNDRNFYPFFDPRTKYNISSVPQTDMDDRTQEVFIGRCLGGSSAINGMIFVRGTRSEYDGWAELGGPDSTWNWEGVLPYFKKASHFTPPEQGLAQAFNITWDPNSWAGTPDSNTYASFPTYRDPQIIPMYNAMSKMPGVEVPLDEANGGNGLFWYPSSIDPENFWRSYSRTGHYDNITRANWDVITGSKTTKILFEGIVADGVEFVPKDNNTSPSTVKATKEVILSAGTIHTPQLLQNSGIGPRALLEQANIPVLVDLPGVGQSLQDHSFLNVSYTWNNGTPPVPSNIPEGDPNSVAASNAGLWIGLPVITPDWQQIATNYSAQSPSTYLPPNTDPTVIAGYSAFQSLHAKLLTSKNSNWLWVAITGTPGGNILSAHVLSHGTVNIDPNDPTGSEPIVDYRALSNPVDMDIMIANIQFMRRYMASPDLAPYLPMEISPGLNVTGEALKAWVRANIIPTNFHPVGTAKKMPRELGGVVDEELRVYGVEGVRVVDGSVMPSLPGANTQQSVYMIAEKAADFIKAGWYK